MSATDDGEEFPVFAGPPGRARAFGDMTDRWLAKRAHRIDRTASVLDKMRHALEQVFRHPRVAADDAARAILAEMASPAASMEDIVECAGRLDKRLRAAAGGNGRDGAASRRRSTRARTFIRL